MLTPKPEISASDRIAFDGRNNIHICQDSTTVEHHLDNGFDIYVPAMFDKIVEALASINRTIDIRRCRYDDSLGAVVHEAP